MMRALTVGLCMSLAACAGSESGNPPARFALVADTPDPSGGVTVDTVYVAVRRADFSQGAMCTDGGPSISAPTFANLAVPPGEMITLPVGATLNYCSVRLRIEHADTTMLPPGVPAELAGNSVLVAGRRADGRRFRVLSSLDRDVNITALAGTFGVDPTTHAALIVFDAGAWLTGVNLDAAPVGADGVAVVDETTAPADAARFDANFSAAISVYSDVDGDGELGTAERPLGPTAHGT